MEPAKLTGLLNLLHVPNVGPQRVRNLLAAFKFPEFIFSASTADLCQIEGIQLGIAQAIRDYDDFGFGEKQLEWAEKLSVRITAYDDPSYPFLLKKIYDPPLLYFVKGPSLDVRQDCIGVVGTRAVTAYGRRATKDLVKGLVENGLTIVSGLARGVDSVAHKTAIDLDGRTVAVLGNGLDQVYPAENRRLVAELLEKGNTMISEFPLGTIPDAGNFPQRNRIISGLSQGLVVIEAGDRSGAMLTAMNAIDQNRDVFAVPGRIYDSKSVGTNRLIRHGAVPVSRAEEILANLQSQLFKPLKPRQETLAIQLTQKQRRIVEHLQSDAVQIDDLATLTGLDITDLLGELLTLELQGVVRQIAGKQFISA